MRFAVHGILADGAASSAGSFPVLLRGLLERGHHVDFFANPGYVRPRSLERYPGYRFQPLHMEAAEVVYRAGQALKVAYASAASSQFSHFAYDYAAKRRIHELHASTPYDLVLCTDTHTCWPTSLPMVSWPQGPPQVEAAALRIPETARMVVRNSGAGYYAAVQGFYAYRWFVARAARSFSDLYLVATPWAREQWIRFGVRPERVQVMPYAIELGQFDATPDVGRNPTLELLWLGRAAPRKRLDLFLAAFAELRARRSDVRARLVGNLNSDPFARPILARFANVPDVTILDPVPRERVPALLAGADVLVQPSQNENFGFGIAEALAAGRPVVAGPTNGTFAYAGAAGFAFDAYTPGSIAAAMERAVVAARSRGAELSATAREAARVFTPDDVVERFLQTARELVVSHARR
jgi:glycosyltransferase involved in cell wall biosynthesis